MITKTNPEYIESYNKDASNYRGNADVVYIPENTEELAALVAELYGKNVRFTVSGAGTGLCGGRTVQGGAVISTENLSRIIDIDYEKKTAEVEPGVLLSDLETRLHSHRCFYPPNPTEKDSSIGGNIANNSSGSRTFKYGPTRNYVEALQLILPDGDRLAIERGEHCADGDRLALRTDGGRLIELKIPDIKMPAVKNAAGFWLKPSMDAIDLFIGSEGTLAVVAGARLRFLEQPERVTGLLIFFDEEKKLFSFVDEVRELSLAAFGSSRRSSGLSARLIEFFDRQSLTLLSEKYPQIPSGAAGAIWVEQEHTLDDDEEVLSAWYSLIEKYTVLFSDTWAATNEKSHEELREFRHSLPLMVTDIIGRNGQVKFGTDTAVPDVHNYRFYRSIMEHIQIAGLPYVVYGHIGNSHYHANVFVSKDSEIPRARQFYSSVLTEALSLGGTISAEHGVGKIKKEYLVQMYGQQTVEAMKAIKKAFDPAMLLGRGNVFD